MILSDRANNLFEYAIKKKWDVSLTIYNGKFMASLNPNDITKMYTGESKNSMDEAIENCKDLLLKDRKKCNK